MIIIVGAGSFGTALSNALAQNNNNKVIILGRDKNVIQSINFNRINFKYFPFITLNGNISATTDVKILRKGKIVLLALPSNVIIDFVSGCKSLLKKETIVVNLAKGLAQDGKTITEHLRVILPSNIIATMKGPTFADELIRGTPSAFTIASDNKEIFKLFEEITSSTNIILDFTQDVNAVEILSVLKNIYAIAIGIVDAVINSANTRFFLLTKAFNEIRTILNKLGCNENTLFKYCGFGDFTLTSLNDLSRNRTLGLMIGKGFYQNGSKINVILEGKRSVKILYEKMIELREDVNLIMLKNLYDLLFNGLAVSKFIKNIIKANTY